MTTKTTSVVLAVLLALLVGYVVGTERAASSPKAWAGPTESAKGWSGDWVTSSPEGTRLTVWRMNGGVPTEASNYIMVSTAHDDGKGAQVFDNRVVGSTYPMRTEGK
jgi:hypothetical protein